MPPARIAAALTAIVAVLIPLSCVQLVARLLIDSDEFVAYNGILKLPGESLVETAVTAVAWTFAIAWALTILSGRYDRPARAALRFLPLGLAALATAVGTYLAIFFGFGALASNMGDAFWIPLALAVIPLSYFTVRLGLVLAVAVLEEVGPGPAFALSWRLAQGRTVRLSVLFAAGVILPAVLAAKAIDWLESSAGVLMWPGRQILLAAVAVLQTLAFLQAWRIAMDRPLPVPSGEYRRGVGLALALAMLVPAGLAFLTTAAVATPQVSTRQQKSLIGGVLAAAWPRGHNPVLVTGGSILDCLDPQCHDVNTTALGYGVSEPSGSVTIRSDGSVYTASREGLEVCDTRRVCDRSPIPVEQLTLARARAIVLAPYGGIYVATAREVPSAQDPEESAIELALVFCAQVTCDRPDVVRLGIVPGSLTAAASPVLAANIGPDTRPYVTFRLPGQDAWVGWCAPVTCSDPGLGRVGESRVPGTPTIEQLVAAHVDRRLLPCPQVCDERQLIPEISRPDGGIYRVAIESYDPKPMRVSVGARPQRPQRAVLLACTEAGCDGARRVPLADYPSYSTRDEWVMAADPDGARVVLATASYSPWTIFVVAL